MHSPQQVTKSHSENSLEGVLQVQDERRDGVLRDPQHLLRPVRGGISVPRQMIREMQLRPGLLISGQIKGRMLSRLQSIEGLPVDEYATHAHLYEGTALDPAPMIKLEHDAREATSRVIDLVCPIGFGQRGLIVAPPRSGKTILMQNMAKGVHANYPDVEIVLLLVDERPEEVTDMKRNCPGTVYASSNDNTVDKHLDLSQLVIERCKRKVEFGKDIVVFLDSLTRLGRAFNTGGRNQGGRTLSGGLDNRAMEIPKRLFGAARKLEEGGSLTIIASCLIDTGSRMDQVIFEEFKGTGNMEITLDRKLSEQRIFPAIDIPASGTRKEEKLYTDAETLAAVHRIRRHMTNLNPTQAMKTMLEVLAKYPTNQAVLSAMKV